MAYIRQPSTDPTGTTYLRVLADGLGTNQITELNIHCSNGTSQNATVEGGTTGNYRSTTQTFTGLSSGQSYSFWGTGKTSGGTDINVPSSSFSTTSNSFNWDVAKTANGMYNLSANEWNGLLNKINERRSAKGLSQVSFNRTVTLGAINAYIVPQASSYNAAVDAINAMSPSTSAYHVASGDIVTAASLNNLKASLNSIT